VEDRERTAAGTDTLKKCSAALEICDKRFAHKSLAKETGNPVRSGLSRKHAFTTKRHTRAGVLVKYAPAVLGSHLCRNFGPIRVKRDGVAMRGVDLVIIEHFKRQGACTAIRSNHFRARKADRLLPRYL